MPFRVIAALAVLGVLFSTAAPITQDRAAVAQGVLDRTAAGERVRVIVGVDASFVPEGQLDGVAAVASQRDRMRVATSGLMAQAAAAGVDTEPPFDFIPFFPATVTRASLEQLRRLPGVTGIEEVVDSPPATYVSVPLTNTPAAWTAGHNGSGWTVAVLDSGVDITHSMLAGATVSEACYSSGGTSLCPGGVTESTSVGSGRHCSPAVDSNCDHGTHVASIAVGAAGTSFGPGVAPGAWLIPMQVFHYSAQAGGILTNTVDYVKGLNRVLALAGPNNANRIAAVNMSLGGGQISSQAQCDAENASVKAAIDNLRSIGIATVVASGNSGYTNAMGRPACISTAVSVGSTTKFAPISVSSFSNEAPFLSLLAPGSDIDAASFYGLYDVKSGTSMAAPHVAGAWAILKQAVPGASVTSVLAALRATGTAVRDNRTGRSYPFINVNAARLGLASGAYSTPGMPSGFSASANGNLVSLSWGPPAAGSGGAPTSYTVLVRPGPGGPILQSVPLGGAMSIAAPVPNGVYHLSVRAANAVGAGPETAGVTLTVPGVPPRPGNPTNLTVSASGNAASFNWTAPAGGGPRSGYLLLAGTSPGFTAPFATLPLSAAATSFAIGGIPPAPTTCACWRRAPAAPARAPATR